MRLRLELGYVVSYRIILHVHQNNFNLSEIAKEKLKYGIHIKTSNEDYFRKGYMKMFGSLGIDC